MNQTAFSQSQFDAIYPEGIEKYYWNLARNNIIYHWLLRYGGKDRRMLEVGCGRGVVVQYLRNKSIDCYGVEAASIVPVANLEAYISTGTEHTAMDETFRKSIDTILLFDVIEHISDEVVFIKSICLAFPNLKRIVVTVPARMELWSNYDTYNGHFRRYSINSLKELSDSLSIPLAHCAYIFHSLYLPARLSLVWSKKRDTHIYAPHGWRVFMHKLIADYLFMDYLFLPVQMPGTSIICSFDLRWNDSNKSGNET